MANQHDLAVTDSIVGFHAQQTVEKSLKSVIASRGVEFPFSHELAGLMKLCDSAGVPVPPTLAEAPRLTPYGARMRCGEAVAQGVSCAEAAAGAAEAIAWTSGVVGSRPPRH